MSIKCSNEGLELYEAIRKNKKYRYIIFRIASDALIEVESIGPRENDFKQFTFDLIQNGPTECRYGLFDLEYMRVCDVTQQELKREKLVLLSWCPSGAKPKRKILYLSYLHQFLDQLKGVHYYKTARDLIELSQAALEEHFH